MLKTPWRTVFLATSMALAVGCAAAPLRPPGPPPATHEALPPLFDDIQERTFRYFWDLADPETGLVPDRYPTPSASSIAAVGFALTAYPIGIERGYVTRTEAAKRVLETLRFFDGAPQGAIPSAVSGYRGFYYHFLDMKTGYRAGDWVELSTIDTSLLLAGVLFCETYFDGDGDEVAIRAVAERLYRRVDWQWASPRPPLVAMGFKPEVGLYPNDWRAYDESMIVYILGLGSPTHPLPEGAWRKYIASARWGEYQGRAQLGFPPLFGHQYSHVWIDFHGIQDDLMRSKGIDYFENSRRATLSQRDYAETNPSRFKGYGRDVFGLTACDGPDGLGTVDGEQLEFWGYAARGAGADGVRDDGTIAPTAALSSLPFAPEAVVPAILEMHRRYGEHLYSKYGFLDAFNPSVPDGTPVKQGRVVPGSGWFDTDTLGIDHGPILAMIENYRTGLIWRVMRRNPHIRRGLLRAGFRGGWLAEPSPAVGANPS